MPDREKVIKGLEVCTSTADGESCPKDCPYYQEVCYGYNQLMRDALALLQEQEAKTQGGDNGMCEICSFYERALPVKPEREHSGSGITWWNVCGNCKTAINPNDKFCHECGRPVLWKGR